MFKSRRLLALPVAAVIGLAFAPGAAHASLLAVDPDSCAEQPLGQVFLPFADIAHYTPAPGGDAESADALDLTGGATLVDGNEPWQVGGAADSTSVRLPAGSSVTTGALCVGLGHPTMRFFAKSQGTGLLSMLKVEVLFQGVLGLNRLPIGVALPSSSWTPTLPMTVVANLLPLLPPNSTPVAFRLTPVGSGTWTVDDIYVDPYKGR
ncbi:hypothetical protein DSM112329_01400 [Paraconexibacter sp. AEG42_29]|uniref:Secreted protein n=1 Tax=Paraconexibacter sp. AEG42_29 TaxID=2997339 RepID=A0AAU7ASF7_9ACTN